MIGKFLLNKNKSLLTLGIAGPSSCPDQLSDHRGESRCQAAFSLVEAQAQGSSAFLVLPMQGPACLSFEWALPDNKMSAGEPKAVGNGPMGRQACRRA